MESQDLTPVHHSDTSRPSLGFPLGTALLLIIIFSLSGFFSCCYHWEKLRSLRRSFSGHADPDSDPEPIPSPSKPTSPYPNLKGKPVESLPVIMPGDNIPKFMALPCPCEPPRPEKISIQIQTPPMLGPPPRPPLPPSSHPQIVYNHVARFGVYYDG